MVLRQPKNSEHIGRKPVGNIYHGIRIAEALGMPLNQFVSLNFSLTACAPDDVSRSFQKLRDTFAKWVTRPRAQVKDHKAAPTFVWVIENPPSKHINVHWLVHIPVRRQADFKKKLPHWLRAAAGEILDDKAIHIEGAYNSRGAGRYMLKGAHPAIASFYGVRPESQGWVRGKRSGFSRNIGPTQKQRLRENGQYPKTRRRFLAVAA